MKKGVFKTAALIAGCILAASVVHKIDGESLPAAATTLLVPSKAGAASWEQVFQRPGPVNVEPLYTGTVRAKKAGLFNLKHPNATIPVDEMVEIPDRAYLIKHEMRGYFLVDAGLSASAQRFPSQNCYRALSIAPLSLFSVSLSEGAA
jgi:hypothetical protein